MLGETLASTEQTRRLRLLIDKLPALIGYWDHEARNVIANDAYVDFFGMTPAEIHGLHISEVLGQEVYALNLPYIRGALAGEEQSFERTLVDQHGATHYTQASYVPDVVDGVVRGFYVLVTDVTARVAAEIARDEAVRLYQISMAHAPIGKAVIDTTGHFVQVNPALCALLGHSAEDLVGADIRPFVHPEDLAQAEADLAVLADRVLPQVASERRYIRSDGTVVWVQRTSVLVEKADGPNDIIVAQFQDVTARKHAEAELARLAVSDALTGLRNRHALIEDVRALRADFPDAPVGVVFVDLDQFKEVNDTLGHAAGDAVLVQAAARLTAAVAAPNTVYRIGGDEFVVLTPEAVHPHAVAALAGDVRRTLTGRYDAGSASVALTAAVGWTRGGTNDVEALLRAADADMYRHKNTRQRADLEPGLTG